MEPDFPMIDDALVAVMDDSIGSSRVMISLRTHLTLPNVIAA